MPNTFNKLGPFLTITFAAGGAVDWVSKTESGAGGAFPSGMIIEYIQFFGSANDVFKVRNGSLTGPSIVKCNDISGEGKLIRLGMKKRCFPVIKADDLTLSSPGDVEVIIHFAEKESENPDEL